MRSSSFQSWLCRLGKVLGTQLDLYWNLLCPSERSMKPQGRGRKPRNAIFRMCPCHLGMCDHSAPCKHLDFPTRVPKRQTHDLRTPDNREVMTLILSLLTQMKPVPQFPRWQPRKQVIPEARTGKARRLRTRTHGNIPAKSASFPLWMFPLTVLCQSRHVQRGALNTALKATGREQANFQDFISGNKSRSDWLEQVRLSQKPPSQSQPASESRCVTRHGFCDHWAGDEPPSHQELLHHVRTDKGLIIIIYCYHIRCQVL